ncbi:hypothetical protein Syun_013520 [Stephania yunnanensis]|uniref:BHLH domain-containing protein n=1 Tax=Stephania yunnanensis TaxID=152371 RepID=A0AAP0JJM9_9MAGN
MEFNNGHGFLEELMSLRRESWDIFNTGGTTMDDLLCDGWNFDCFNQTPDLVSPNYLYRGVAASADHRYGSAFGDHASLSTELDLLQKTCDAPHFDHHLVQEDHYNNPSLVEDEDYHSTFISSDDHIHSLEEKQNCSSVEPAQTTGTGPVFNAGICLERKNRVKKIDGKPSKNLMAERRRRKRLNDRLSMLRSVVPKISKMDRTSILGDTIDYMKELLERIKNLQEDMDVNSDDELNLMGIFKELKTNEIMIRNTPKFDVERRITGTRIDVCCSGKPGLLLSTMATIESLGLDIQQCVISCFSDFAMQASCSEELGNRSSASSEEIKEALFRNAGYGGVVCRADNKQ